jgi:hypothetical protein
MADRRRRRRSTHPEPGDAAASETGKGKTSVAPSPEGGPDDPLVESSDDSAEARQAFALDGLAIAGITRRRAGWIAAAAFTMWIVLVFARQVGDASAKSSQVDQRRSDNAALQADVAALQEELVLIQKQAYISQQAHAYRLGDEQDRPFTLAAGAPALSANAPGSAAVRLGAIHQARSPLETWLSVLFGPGR